MIESLEFERFDKFQTVAINSGFDGAMAPVELCKHSSSPGG